MLSAIRCPSGPEAGDLFSLATALDPPPPEVLPDVDPLLPDVVPLTLEDPDDDPEEEPPEVVCFGDG